jgi:hemerythrin-like domain-containing protein
MNQPDNWLVHEHSLYEDLLSRCRDAADAEDWATVDSVVHELVTHLKRHMALEEEVLFPAYEATLHAPQGPTMALRDEHSSIVRLIVDTAHVIRSRDSDHVRECLLDLENLMIKHHEKEEDIFLPMASQILSTSRDELLRKLAGFTGSKIKREWGI